MRVLAQQTSSVRSAWCAAEGNTSPVVHVWIAEDLLQQGRTESLFAFSISVPSTELAVGFAKLSPSGTFWFGLRMEWILAKALARSQQVSCCRASCSACLPTQYYWGKLSALLTVYYATSNMLACTISQGTVPITFCAPERSILKSQCWSVPFGGALCQFHAVHLHPAHVVIRIKQGAQVLAFKCRSLSASNPMWQRAPCGTCQEQHHLHAWQQLL